MLVPHIVNHHRAVIDIGDVEVALFVQFGPNVAQTAPQDHYLSLFVLVQALLYHGLQLLKCKVPFIIDLFKLLLNSASGLLHKSLALIKSLTIATVPKLDRRVVWKRLGQEDLILPT